MQVALDIVPFNIRGRRGERIDVDVHVHEVPIARSHASDAMRKQRLRDQGQRIRLTLAPRRRWRGRFRGSALPGSALPAGRATRASGNLCSLAIGRPVSLARTRALRDSSGVTVRDTDPAIEKLLVEGYRKMTPTRKLEIVNALTVTVQTLALADIRRRHPLADEREQKLRLASRWLDPATMRRVFDWDPDVQGY